MKAQYTLHNLDPLGGGNIRQADQTGMPRALLEDQGSKIGVDRDEHAVGFHSTRQQNCVAGIGSLLPRVFNVVALALQPLADTNAHASVQYEFHAVWIGSGYFGEWTHDE